MIIIAPNAEASLRAVRELSERATVRPARRQARIEPLSRPAVKLPQVWHPWRMRSAWLS